MKNQIKNFLEILKLELDDLVIHINETFRTVMKACGYAEAGRIGIKRKMLKVAKYVQSD